jgi:Flp pilus assembly CpaF family ATPase
MQDEGIKEIFVNSGGHLSCLLITGARRELDLIFSHDEITDFIMELAWHSRVRLDPFLPFAGGVIPGEPWRWHAATMPLSPDGSLLVIRRQQFQKLQFSHFKMENFSSTDLPNWLHSGVSVIFYGAAGSGKTSLLVATLREFFTETRVGVAETVTEIPLMSPHWFRLAEVPKDTGGFGGVDFKRVIAEMMRLSPGLLVLGEIRGEEAEVLSSFARTGHGGVLSTIHAGSSGDARERITSLAKTPLSQMPPMVGVQLMTDPGGIYRACAERLN